MKFGKRPVTGEQYVFMDVHKEFVVSEAKVKWFKPGIAFSPGTLRERDIANLVDVLIFWQNHKRLPVSEEELREFRGEP